MTSGQVRLSSSVSMVTSFSFLIYTLLLFPFTVFLMGSRPVRETGA